MLMRYILKVFFVVIVIWWLFNFYKSGEKIFESTQFVIKYLTDIHLYFRQQLIQFVQSKFCNEKCKIFEVKNNSDLSEYKEKCPYHRYTTRIIERSPLIIYIQQFLTQNEIDHLISLSESLLRPSMVFEENGTYSINQHRTSTSASIKRHQTSIVTCIERRFAQFQGEIDLERMEPLQVVKYTNDQQYKPHYDWLSSSSDPLKNGGQRVTTFFTYLQSNCSMGETEFIDIQFNKSFHQQFCDILVCDENSFKHGIRFRPLSGNTIFWYNMDEHGQVDYLTYHAGRPPGQYGYKIGLNTWTRIDKFL